MGLAMADTQQKEECSEKSKEFARSKISEYSLLQERATCFHHFSFQEKYMDYVYG